MDALQAGVRVTFDDLDRAEANRAVQELRQGRRHLPIASIDRDHPDSRDAGATLVLLFGSSVAVAIAQGIRAYLARRNDNRDRITIRTVDGTEIVATGEAARVRDAAALVRAIDRGRRGQS